MSEVIKQMKAKDENGNEVEVALDYESLANKPFGYTDEVTTAPFVTAPLSIFNDESDSIPEAPALLIPGNMYRVSIEGATKQWEGYCIDTGEPDIEGGTIGDQSMFDETIPKEFGFGFITMGSDIYEEYFGTRNVMMFGATDNTLFAETFGISVDSLTESTLITIEEYTRGVKTCDLNFIPTKSYTVELTPQNWSGDTAPYSQSVSVPGVTNKTIGMVGISDSASDEEYEVATKAQLRKSSQGKDRITIKCYGAKPDIIIPITISGIWN